MTCVSTGYGTTPETANATLLLPVEKAPRGCQAPRITSLSAALDLQSNVFLSPGAVAAVLFVIGEILLAAKIYRSKKDEEADDEEDSKPSLLARFIESAPQRVLLFSTFLSLVAATSVTQTGGALEFATTEMTGCSGSVVITAGKALQVLQWLAFAISSILLLVLWRWERMDPGETEDDAESTAGKNPIRLQPTQRLPQPPQLLRQPLQPRRMPPGPGQQLPLQKPGLSRGIPARNT